MPNQLTVTLPVGPGDSVTSLVISNVTDINFNLQEQVLTVVDSNSKIREFDLASAATVTYTISGGIATVAVSS